MTPSEQRISEVLRAEVDQWSPTYDSAALEFTSHRVRERNRRGLGIVIPVIVAGACVLAVSVVTVLWPAGGTDVVITEPTPGLPVAGEPGAAEEAVVITRANDGETVDLRLGQDVRLEFGVDDVCLNEVVFWAVDYDGSGLARGETSVRKEKFESRADENVMVFTPKHTGIHRLAVYVADGEQCERVGDNTEETITAREPTWSVRLQVTG